MTGTPKIKRGKERRTENRCAFMGELPGRLLHESLELHFIPIDISRKGLGVMLDPCPAEGEEILVEFENKFRGPLRFTVKHIYEGASAEGDTSDSDFGDVATAFRPSMQRCGIELISHQQENVDLIELFTRYAVPVV